MKKNLLLFGLFPFISWGQTDKTYEIQGSGSVSPLDGQIVTTEGVVYATYPGLSLYAIQDTLGDGDIGTSDGLFVYNPSTIVSIGNYVEVTGTVDEFYGLTEITGVSNENIVAASVNLPIPMDVNLPLPNVDDYEGIEGMYVRFPQNLIVTDNYQLHKYGEFTLGYERLKIATDIIDPNDNPASGTNYTGTSNVSAINAKELMNEAGTIMIDDMQGGSYPNPVPYLNPVDGTLRAGSTVQNATGALTYSFSKWRVLATDPIVINYATRPTIPAKVGDIRVASFNVLNFFTTIDDGMNGARGADSQSEYVRQRTKIIAALDSIDADIYALIEMENEAGAYPADTLVTYLNQVTGNTYAVASESPFTGTYAIKNMFIYNTATVTPLDTMMTSTNPLFYPPPISRDFEINATAGRVNIICNHYRYKGCQDASGLDLDQNDGQGCYNETRKQQSLEMLNFISYIEGLVGHSNIMMLGDFNAYSEEDPIDIFRANGFINETEGQYSYAYQNQFGALDHVLSTPSMTQYVVNAEVWNINSDEPIGLDYNEENITDDLYVDHPYRSSDHDPIIVDLNSPPLLGLIEDQNGYLEIYPNPSGSSFFVMNQNGKHYQIYSMEGKLIQQGEFRQNKEQIGVNLTPGSYIIKIENSTTRLFKL